MSVWQQLVDTDSGEIIIQRLEVADTFWRRFKGLQLRSTLAADQGLLLVPCRSIHTHWMRFPIDVAMLDDEGTVLAIFAEVRPWKIVPRVKGTRSVVEAVQQTLSTKTQVGSRLTVSK